MNNNMSAGEKFIIWLDKEEALKGWTDYELAKRAKVSHSMLSRARNESIPPKWDALVKIARVLNRNPIAAFQAAGLLSPSDAKIADEITERSEHIVKNYKRRATKIRALEYLEFLQTQEEKDDGDGTYSDRESKESLKRLSALNIPT